MAVLVVGPLGYAAGGISRSDTLFGSPLGYRSHLRVNPDHYGPLLSWTALTGVILVGWTVLPVSATPSSVAVAPVFVTAGLVVAGLLGYRARGASTAVIAGSIVSVLACSGSLTGQLELGDEGNRRLCAVARSSSLASSLESRTVRSGISSDGCTVTEFVAALVVPIVGVVSDGGPKLGGTSLPPPPK